MRLSLACPIEVFRAARRDMTFGLYVILFAHHYFQIHVLGSPSLIAYRTLSPASAIESNFLTKERVELKPQKYNMKPLQYMPRRNPCSVDSLYSRIAVVEKLLRRLLGNTTHEPQNRLSGFLKAKVKASTVVRFQFEFEMDVPTVGFRQDSQPKLRTKCSIERGRFDVVARVDG